MENNNVKYLFDHVPTREYADPWEAPILFDDHELPVIKAEWLPGAIGQFAKSLAVATETDESMATMVILGVLSTCLAKHVWVSPKEGWQEPVNIFTLIALPPANSKSLVIRQCCKPLIDWEAEQQQIMSPKIKQRRSEIETEKRIVAQMRNEVAKEKDWNEQKSLSAKIAEREANIPEPLFEPKLFTNDSTPEALAEHVYQQQGRFALISDEGGIFETLSGLYNNGNANIDLVLKGIDGGMVRISRKNNVYQLEPFLTFVMCVQPQIISDIASKAPFTGKGFLERFLYVLPKSNLGFRSHDKPGISRDIQQQYHQAITALLSVVDRQQAITLTLAKDAYTEWRDFQRWVEAELRTNGSLAHCPGWGGKISGFALRIAGLLALAKNPEAREICFNTMMAALNITDALVRHAIVAFEVMSYDQELEDAKELYELIVSRSLQHFTQTEINRLVRRRKIRKAERLAKALKLLESRVIIRRQVNRATQKPTIWFTVNPQLLKEEKEQKL